VPVTAEATTIKATARHFIAAVLPVAKTAKRKGPARGRPQETKVTENMMAQIIGMDGWRKKLRDTLAAEIVEADRNPESDIEETGCHGVARLYSRLDREASGRSCVALLESSSAVLS
jgi:hypothetical protein